MRSPARRPNSLTPSQPGRLMDKSRWTDLAVAERPVSEAREAGLPLQGHHMEFSELFTQSVREVLPLVRDKNLVSYFDYRGPFIDLLDGDAGLRAAIHRILRGIIDCIDTGFVMFSAEVKAARGGCSKVLVHAAGTGVTNLNGIQRVLQRLQLQPLPAADAAAAGGVSSARGACPASGGTATFLDGGPEGLVISLEILVAAVEAQGASPFARRRGRNSLAGEPDARGPGPGKPSACAPGMARAVVRLSGASVDVVGCRARRSVWASDAVDRG